MSTEDISFIQEQCTPLYVALANGYSDVVKSLIAGNADVNCICKVSCYNDKLWLQGGYNILILGRN